MKRSLRFFACALLVALPAVGATKRELAADQFRKAQQLLDDLKAVPKLELGAKQYNLVADAFRKVHRITPASSYCDDALFRAAEVTAMMAERFDSDVHRDKAVAAYRFLIREYPHSGLLGDARRAAARLQAEPQPEPVQAVEDRSPAAASDQPAATAVSTRPAPSKPRLSNRAQPSPKRTSQGLADVSDLRHHATSDGVRIVVELDDFVPYKFDFLSRPRRLYFDFFTSRLSGKMVRGANYEVSQGSVARIRLGQNRRTKARLVVDLLDEVTYDISWLANPPRLVIELQGETPQPVAPSRPQVRLAAAKAPAPPSAAGRADTSKAFEQAFAEASESSAPAPQATAVSLAPPKPATVNSAGGQSLIRALGLKIGRVVIDAGHGGHDPGMVGPSGLQEKSVVLDISQRLARLIEDELGAEAILTRDSDRFVDLQQRTRVANDSKADLFVSIHANASNSRSVRGVETSLPQPDRRLLGAQGCFPRERSIQPLRRGASGPSGQDRSQGQP